MAQLSATISAQSAFGVRAVAPRARRVLTVTNSVKEVFMPALSSTMVEGTLN